MMVRTVKLQLKSYGLLHSTSSRSSLQSSINSFQQFAAKAPNATPFLTVNILSSGSVHKKSYGFLHLQDNCSLQAFDTSR